MTTKSPPDIDPRLAYLYDENGVFYPDEDGVPLPDGFYQEPLFVRAVSTVRGHFRDRPDVAVSGNTFVYYEQGNPRRFVSPDCYAAFNVDLDHIFYRNTYRVWEMGKPPDFALEIASKSTAAHDVRGKPALYASIGIGEYWLYDATPDSEFYGLKLYGGYLHNGRYEPFEIHEDADGLVWGHSPALGLDLCWDAGKLRFRIPATGEFLPDYEETLGARDEAETRAANAEAQRDDALSENERLRAEIERLRAELGREHG